MYITSVEDLIPTDDENFPPIGKLIYNITIQFYITL